VTTLVEAYVPLSSDRGSTPLGFLNPFTSKGLSRLWGQGLNSVGSKIVTVLTAAFCGAPVATVAFLGTIRGSRCYTQSGNIFGAWLIFRGTKLTGSYL